MHNKFKKVKSFVNRISGFVLMAVSGVLLLPCMNVSASSGIQGFTSYSGETNGNNIIKSIAKVFGIVAAFIGAIYLASAIYQLVQALRNEDSDGRNRAALNIGVAIALLSFGAILTVVMFK